VILKRPFTSIVMGMKGRSRPSGASFAIYSKQLCPTIALEWSEKSFHLKKFWRWKKKTSCLTTKKLKSKRVRVGSSQQYNQTIQELKIRNLERNSRLKVRMWTVSSSAANATVGIQHITSNKLDVLMNPWPALSTVLIAATNGKSFEVHFIHT
jgi:hypothetical protein